MARHTPSPWQRHPVTQLLAVIIALTPLYGLSIWSGVIVLHRPHLQTFNVTDTLLNTVGTVGAFGGLMLLLLWLMCGERLRDLQLRAGTWKADINLGIWLALMLYVVQIAFAALLVTLRVDEYPTALEQLGRHLAASPLLLLVWLLPVAWLQGGLLEEFARVFMLSRLWRVYPSTAGRLLVLLASALLFGLGHVYQGATGILGTTVLGLVFGWHYLRFGRVLPLIVGHAVYDMLVMVQIVWAAPV